VFEALVADVRPRLARAFVAAYGPERGQEALAEALAYAWEHATAVQAMTNPAGYLYRVGQSRTRPRLAPPTFPAPADVGVPWVEPGLPAALAGLSEHQRVAVVLVHGYGWTHREVGELLGIAATTVQNHVERGLAGLRRRLEVVVAPDA
jgi:DNA-directed RNA polymerase specialized sigma24 family protein